MTTPPVGIGYADAAAPAPGEPRPLLALTDTELLRVVAEFRAGVMGSRRRSEGYCLLICMPLAGLLSAVYGVPCQLRTGWVNLDVGQSNHYWIELADGRVIDPTADQFNKRLGRELPRIYLGLPDKLVHVPGELEAQPRGSK